MVVWIYSEAYEENGKGKKLEMQESNYEDIIFLSKKRKRVKSGNNDGSFDSQ